MESKPGAPSNPPRSGIQPRLFCPQLGLNGGQHFEVADYATDSAGAARCLHKPTFGAVLLTFKASVLA